MASATLNHMASATTRAITAEQFAIAIQDLPLENLYAKASEIENSIAHLQRSNAQLKEFSDSIRNDATIEGETREEVGDRECLDAIRENEEVIARQRERVEMLKGEAERRGQRWHGAGGAAAGGGEENAVNGTGAAARSGGGRLTDEDLRRRMEEQMGGDDDDDDGRDGGGMHL